MTIILLPSDWLWEKLFADESAKLHQVLGNIIFRIEHIGSTAIPGIYAKPVIDILIGVKNLKEFKELGIKKIEPLGYWYKPTFESEFPNRLYFEKNDSSGKRTYQIHVVNFPSACWERHILFRNFLRSHPIYAKRYEQEKLRLAQKFDDTVEYANAKTAFCQAIDNLAFHDFERNPPFITSARFNVYIPQISCLDDYISMVEDKEFIKCCGFQVNKETARNFLITAINHWNSHGFGLLMWYDKLNNEFVGCSGSTLHKARLELAYGIKYSYWGKGVTVEQCRIIIDYAFTHLKYDHLESYIWEDNKQSFKVIEKLGFKYVKDTPHQNLPSKLYHLKKTP